MKTNVYPVSFRDFEKIRSVGNYVIYYCVLDDRICIEMPIENSIFLTQKFIASIEEEIKDKADNYSGDKVNILLKMTFRGCTFYRYYPNEEEVKELKKYKYYDKLVVNNVNKESKGQVTKIIEFDDKIKTMVGNEVVMEARKV